MADPAFQQIIAAFTTAFQASTASFQTITNKLEAWWDWPPNKFPGVCIINGNIEKSRFCFPQPTESDMYAEAIINIKGYDFDITNNLEGKRETLRKNIESVVLNSTAINDVTMDCIVQGEDDDEGQLENFIVINSKVKVKYLYNHITL